MSPVPIRSIGLPTHLANTINIHNGNDYRVLDAMIKAHASNRSICRAFNINEKTFTRTWLPIYEEEQEQQKHGTIHSEHTAAAEVNNKNIQKQKGYKL